MTKKKETKTKKVDLQRAKDIAEVVGILSQFTPGFESENIPLFSRTFLLKNLLGFTEKELEENQIFTRPPLHIEEWVTNAPMIKDDVSIYDMLQALGKVFQRKKWREPLETTIHKMEISIEERMEEIVKKVNETNKQIPFHELFPFPNRGHIVTTFLAILQLLKQNEIDCIQNAHFETIYICKLEGSNA